MATQNRATFDRLGCLGHTPQRLENDLDPMCGDINRHSIVYKSAGHLTNVGLASDGYRGHRPIQAPFSADVHDVRAGIARLPVDASTI